MNCVAQVRKRAVGNRGESGAALALRASVYPLRRQIAPPYQLLESDDHYSIVFNLLGVSRPGVALSLNEEKNELTLFVKRERDQVRTGFYWTFVLPAGTTGDAIRTVFRGGGLEIQIPKVSVTQ